MRLDRQQVPDDRKFGLGIRTDCMERTTSAAEMAEEAGVDVRIFKARLRDKRFRWGGPYNTWEVVVGSPDHTEMLIVIEEMKADGLQASDD